VFSAKFSVLGCLTFIFFICACSDDLKEPPGKLYGTVTLSPEPLPGQNWANIRASSEIAEYSTVSDATTHQFAFEDLKVADLQTKYLIEVTRDGYISYSDSIWIEAGVSISNYNVTLRRGARQDTSFQDGVSPDSGYFGCLDTYISASDSLTSFGADPYLVVGGGTHADIKRGLMQFVFSWPQYYPAVDTFPKVVESAKLRLHVDSVLTSGSVQFAVVNMTQTFLENSANWIDNGSAPWTGGPGGSPGVLWSDTVSVSGLTEGFVEFSIEDIASQWLENSNSGPMMLMLVDEARLSTIFIRSADNDSTALRPKLHLVINYLQ